MRDLHALVLSRACSARPPHPLRPLRPLHPLHTLRRNIRYKSYVIHRPAHHARYARYTATSDPGPPAALTRGACARSCGRSAVGDAEKTLAVAPPPHVDAPPAAPLRLAAVYLLLVAMMATPPDAVLSASATVRRAVRRRLRTRSSASRPASRDGIFLHARCTR